MLDQSARTAQKDFETENGVRNCVAVRKMVKTKFLQASVDWLSESALSFSTCRYCANFRAASMS